jgi:hypothetical protein
MQYQHYKGNIYEIICNGSLESNQEEMVVYKDCKSNKIWIRPKKEFFGDVQIDGEQIPRFSVYHLNDMICGTCKRTLTDDDLYILVPPHPISDWDKEHNQKRDQVYICCDKIIMISYDDGKLSNYQIPKDAKYFRKSKN